jgi:hypothetical protein
MEEGRIQVIFLGRSYQETGTLRMGHNVLTFATDSTDQCHGLDNLCIAAAALIPYVGSETPMLTSGGYRDGGLTFLAITGRSS